MNTRQRYLCLWAAWILLLPCTVAAGIYKQAVHEKSATKHYEWPILPQLPGWVHDEAASRRYDSNFLVPRRQTFTTAPAVIYARALYKPKMADIGSVEQLMAADQRQAAHDAPGVHISEQAALQDRDGTGFRCVSFAPPAEGSWEVVAYGEEGDYYLIFTVSASSPVALEKALPDFKQLISRYKKKL